MDENLKACSVAENLRIQRSGHFTELWSGNSMTKMPVKMIQIDNFSKFQFILRCLVLVWSNVSNFSLVLSENLFSVRGALTCLILILSSSIATLAKAEIREDPIRDYFSRMSLLDGYSGNADWKLKSYSSSSKE